ncbi:MAG: hypothetical protein IKJ14_02565 [Clostridia bacterium]|nr:hypothetical protein [Clostridia bacterium]
MIIKEIDVQIMCDVNGCGNVANFVIKKTEEESDYYGLKLCKDCAVKIKNLLTTKVRKKENKSEN